MFRKASFAWYALLALSMVSVGCGKKEEADKDKSDKATKDKKSKKADDDDKKGDDDDSKGKKGKKAKKADDDDDKGKKGDDDDDKGGKKGDDKGADTSAPLSIELEGKTYDFKFGHAKPDNDNIDITLSTEKFPCDKWKTGDDAFTIEFKIGPGTDGKFFAGSKVGAQLYWNSETRKFKRNFAYAYETGLTISPFKLESGEKIKGTLDFNAPYNDFSDPTKKFNYKGAGKFEVELCSSDNDYKTLKALPAFKSDDVAGNWGTDKFESKVAYAYVSKDAYSKEAYVREIYFFENDKVACDEYIKSETLKNEKYLYISGIGGSGEKHKWEGNQPAEGHFSIPVKGKDLGNSHYLHDGRVVVKLDTISYKKGGKISGSLTAKTATGNYDGEGEFNGKFEAKVCNEPW
jgi:hypothetical protein